MSLPAPYYQDESCTIYHGDCRELLPLIGPVDLVLTDPPYNVSVLNGRDNTTVGKVKRADGSYYERQRDFGAWDRDFSVPEFLNAVYPTIKERGGVLAFASDRLLHEYMEGPFSYLRTVIWAKSNAAPQFPGNYQSATEYIAWMGKGGRSLFTGNGTTSNVMAGPLPTGSRSHPNQKPPWLIERLIQLHSKPGEIILDSFMGSGTTLRAAKDLGRKAIGIEIEERYCEIAAFRLSQMVLPLAV